MGIRNYGIQRNQPLNTCWFMYFTVKIEHASFNLPICSYLQMPRTTRRRHRDSRSRSRSSANFRDKRRRVESDDNNRKSVTKWVSRSFKQCVAQHPLVGDHKTIQQHIVEQTKYIQVGICNTFCFTLYAFKNKLIPRRSAPPTRIVGDYSLEPASMRTNFAI